MLKGGTEVNALVCPREDQARGLLDRVELCPGDFAARLFGLIARVDFGHVLFCNFHQSGGVLGKHQSTLAHLLCLVFFEGLLALQVKVEQTIDYFPAKDFSTFIFVLMHSQSDDFKIIGV